MSTNSNQPVVRPYRRDTDIEAVVTLICTSMINLSFYDQAHPARREYPLEFWKITSHKVRTRLSWPNVRAFVAEDSNTHEIIGLAVWEAHGELAKEKDWKNDSMSKRIERSLTKWESQYHKYFLSRCTNYTAYRLLVEQAKEKFSTPKHCPDGYLGLMWLCILPDHQKRGIGTLLLRWGLQVALEQNILVGLDSSDDGVRLYVREGFKIYDYISVHIVGETGMRMPCMLWEPPRLEGKYLEEDGAGGWRLRPEIVEQVRNSSKSARISETRYTSRTS